MWLLPVFSKSQAYWETSESQKSKGDRYTKKFRKEAIKIFNSRQGIKIQFWNSLTFNDSSYVRVQELNSNRVHKEWARFYQSR